MHNLSDTKGRGAVGRTAKEGGSMFEVTAKASEMIREFLKNRTEAPSIRILMQAG